eukprot:SAG31_NODE_820_length_11808_cov_16.331540_11_plen_38_part_00
MIRDLKVSGGKPGVRFGISVNLIAHCQHEVPTVVGKE